MIKIYGIKNCDKCRNAFSELKKKWGNVEFIDIRKNPLKSVDIERFIKVFKLDLVNKRSTTWRQLSDEQQSLSVKELIIFAPSVMKRPIVDNGMLFLGWNTEIKKALGLVK